LIGFEIALVFPVAIGAMLMLQTVNNLVAVDIGYRTDHVLTATVKLSATTCAEFEQCNAAFEDILNRLRALPGVESVAVGGARPFGNPMVLPVTTDEVWDPAQGSKALPSMFQIVTADYFRTLGLTLRTGRTFGANDTRLSPKVAVVNSSFARRMFGDESPIGKRFNLSPANRPGWIEVIGEVADTRDIALSRSPMPGIYVPLSQADLVPRTVLLIRTSGDPMALASLMSGQVHAVDKGAPVTEIDSLDNVRARQTSEPQFQAILLTVFAGLGVVLAVIGIYGLISYATSDRVQEFGIRLALGAKRSDIFRLVIVESFSTIGWGLTFGIGGAVGLSRALRGQLYEVSSIDPITFVLVAVLITLASLLAYFLPARRATRVDPLMALRHE
jgi:putative ABC transport system permease protein